MSTGFAGGGFIGDGFAPTDGPIVAADPIILEIELAAWLASRLGVEVLPDAIAEEVNSFPAICFSTIDGESIYLLTGPSGLGWTTFQFESWGHRSPDALTLNARLFAVLAGYRGAAGRAFIDSVVALGRGTGRASLADGSDGGRYRAMRDYRVYWGEPAPPRL